MRNLATILFGALFASSLAAELAVQYLSIDPSPIVTAGGQRLLQVSGLAQPVQERGPYGGEESLARPLFRQDRRPFSPPIVMPKAEVSTEVPQVRQDESETQPPNLVLTGVSLGPRGYTALVNDADHQAIEWLKPGDVIGKWTLVEIHPGAITLELTQIEGAPQSRIISLELYPEARRGEESDGPW